MASLVQWLSYTFYVSEYGSAWKAVPGIYIFARRNIEGQWEPVYVGVTENLRDQIPGNKKWELAAQSGATHVHVIEMEDAGQRESTAAELVEAYDPPLNARDSG
jgi:hypothetical protein